MTRFHLLLLMLSWLLPVDLMAAANDGKVTPNLSIPRVQNYEIGGIRFSVPVGFLARLDRPAGNTLRKRNSPGQSVQLHVQLPEMIPPSGDLLLRLKDPLMSPEHVSFSVFAVLPELKESALNTFMRRAMAAGTCVAKTVGDVCPYPLLKDHTRETLYLGRKHEFAYCNPKKSVPVPHCETAHMLIDGIIVETLL
ncbi:MAG: hypothetical protein HOH04_17290 [Rhodospirillaceae bacterium]|nr:hypothetical protein [Rhodospirillaceae bacterium]